MYKAVLKNEEYDKYQEIENTIIQQIAQIESKVDKYIYSISKRYDEILDEWFNAIRETENYKNFNNLDKELEKVKQLKEVLEYCKMYFSRVQENHINTKISTFKFELLIRRQIEQIVYRNGVADDRRNFSKLNQYDNQEEAECFCTLLESMVGNIRGDEVLKKHTISQILTDNTLLNHAIFKYIEQDLETEPEKYMPLLKAKIFNPHMCNIANNPFTEKIPYLYNYKRDRVNLTLLNAVIKQMIKKSNTTIMECSRIYNRFGFECKPITISEGQEIVRKIYEKTKHKIEPTKTQNKSKTKTKGKFAQITFSGYDYNFESKEEQFLTNAQMNLKLEDIKSKNKSKRKSIDQTTSIAKTKSKLDEQVTYENMILSDMLIASWLRDKLLLEITGERNKWCRVPLGETFFRRIDRPYGIKKHRRVEGDYVDIQEYTETELWKSYKTDFEQMGILIKAIRHDKNILGEKSHTIAISLDDISDLPIDFDKIHILSRKEIDKLETEER